MRQSPSLTGPDTDVLALLTVYEVVRFAEDKKTCRKILFGRYFRNAYDSSVNTEEDSDKPCGHCDNVSVARPSSPSHR